MKAWQRLAANTDTVVDFDFDGRLPSDNVGTSPEAHTTLSNTAQHPIYVVAVDTEGNRTNTFSPMSFTLEAGHSPQHIATVDRHYNDHPSLAISPDGSHLAIGSGGIVELLDTGIRESITTFRHTPGNRYGNRVAFSHDGTLLASGSGNSTIKVWNVATRQNIATLEGHTDQILSVDFSADGTLLASGSLDRTVRLWNVATWTGGASLEGHLSGIVSVAFLPDGTLASKSSGGTVKLWNVASESEISTLDTEAGGLAISPDGTILASGHPYSYAFKLWDLATGMETATLNRMRDYSWVRFAFSPDGTVLAVAANGLIEMWDVQKEEFIAVISGGPGGVGSLLFSPNGKQLIGSASKGIKFWDVSEWTAPTTPVSDRTPQVRDAIVGFAGVNSANDVTDAHLAEITSLNLGYNSITALKSGDFSGLSSLRILNIENNGLTSLPEDVFDELSSLALLNINDNGLTNLPEDVFDGLSSLESLNIHNNGLTSLPEDVFDGLSSLRILNIENNGLTSLPEDVFDGLSSLRILNIHGNGLTSLPEDDLFGGLSSLQRIVLANNELTTLPNGIFKGLTTLSILLLQGNSVDSLPLTVSLGRVGADQFKAVAPTGAPFNILLPLNVTNGSINEGATTVTIPIGSVESGPLTVTRTSGSRAAVTVDIGALPGLPSNHQGYSLFKSPDLPLEVISRTTDQQAATDFNGDGKTDFVDFFLFADAFGSTDPKFDLDGSGTVDFVDFFQFVDAFDQPGQAKLLAIAQEMIGLPAETELQQNAPNPFNSETVISWFQVEPSAARVEVFALTGQRLAVLHQGPHQSGFHRIHWDGRDDAGRALASGVYLYRLVSADRVLTRKLTLLR